MNKTVIYRVVIVLAFAIAAGLITSFGINLYIDHLTNHTMSFDEFIYVLNVERRLSDLPVLVGSLVGTITALTIPDMNSNESE